MSGSCCWCQCLVAGSRVYSRNRLLDLLLAGGDLLFTVYFSYLTLDSTTGWDIRCTHLLRYKCLLGKLAADNKFETSLLSVPLGTFCPTQFEIGHKDVLSTCKCSCAIWVQRHMKEVHLFRHRCHIHRCEMATYCPSMRLAQSAVPEMEEGI